MKVWTGDTTALARTLGAFATTAIEERLVILRPGRGALAESEEKSTFSWPDRPYPYSRNESLAECVMSFYDMK